MTIKEFAYSTQQHLQERTQGVFKRAHIYELLAAAFGFDSYAALSTKSVFTNVALTRQISAKQVTLVRNRCIELGYPVDLAEAVSNTLTVYLDVNEIGVFAIDGLVALLRTEWDGNWGFADDENDIYPEDLDDIFESRQALTDTMLESPLMLEGLENAANKGNALAHYALALIQRFSEDGEEPEPGSEYWYLEAKAGRLVTGVEKEWVESYEAYLTKSQKYVHHLRAAAMLGEPNALLDLADQFNEPTFFELGMDRVFSSPAYVAEIAERLDRPEDAKRWLTIAAEMGDTDAMRQLIEDYDKNDPLRCWTWLYLAKLLGSDLTKDSHYAINEDGSAYDEDVGGPAFVGGHDGVYVETLNADLDAAAKNRAQKIYDAIQR